MSWLPNALHRVTDREAGGTGRFRRPVLITSASLPVKLVLFAAIIVGAAAILAPWLPLQDPLEQDLQSILTGPTSENLLGTDQLGRDLLSRTLWGARTTLLAAMVAAGVAGIIGIPAALIAGYRRGWIETALNRSSDVIMTVPALVMLLAVQAALQTGIYGSMVTLGIILAPHLYRVIRSEVLTISNSSFLQSGRLSGCSHRRIILRYVLPNVREQAVVQLSFQFGFGLMVEAGISFLGVGVQPPDPSLGSLLNGTMSLISREPMLVFAPGGVLVLLILAFNLAGDLLRTKSKAKHGD